MGKQLTTLKQFQGFTLNGNQGQQKWLKKLIVYIKKLLLTLNS